MYIYIYIYILIYNSTTAKPLSYSGGTLGTMESRENGPRECSHLIPTPRSRTRLPLSVFPCHYIKIGPVAHSNKKQ